IRPNAESVGSGSLSCASQRSQPGSPTRAVFAWWGGIRPKAERSGRGSQLQNAKSRPQAGCFLVLRTTNCWAACRIKYETMLPPFLCLATKKSATLCLNPSIAHESFSICASLLLHSRDKCQGMSLLVPPQGYY